MRSPTPSSLSANPRRPRWTPWPAGSRRTPGSQGTETLDFVAQDAQSGVYRIKVTVGGTVVKNEVVDPSVSTCAAAAGGSSDYEFNGGGRPCPTVASPSAPLEVDTTLLPEGSTTLAAVVEDASGRTVDVVAQRAVVIDNVPAPVAAAPPAISGTAQVRRTLTSSVGGWTLSGRTATYATRWLRCDAQGAGCTDTGRTGTTYDLADGDAGHTMIAEIVATTDEGAGTQRSAPSGTIQPAAPASNPPPNGGGSTATPSGDGANVTTTTVVGNKPAAPAATPGTDSTNTADVCARRPSIRLSSPTRATRSFARSATTLTGRVVDQAGEAVPHAALELTQAVSRVGRTQTTILGTTDTQSDGSFSIRVPTGPSRSLQLGFLSCATRSEPVVQKVRGSLSLKTSTPRVRNRHTARFGGRVVGGYRGKGIVLELQARAGNKWIDVHSLKTDAAGRFQTSYRFMHTFDPYRYSFRVVTRAGDAWPFLQGASTTVKVSVR